MRNIVRVMRNTIVNTVELYKAMKLDKNKTVDIINSSATDNSTMIYYRCLYNDKEMAQNAYNHRKQAHEEMIRKVIDILEAEGLIKNHITVKLTDDMHTNYHSSIPYLKDTKDGRTILKHCGHEIHVSHTLDADFIDYMENYIRDTFGKEIWPCNSSLTLFTFLHEFGHYVDSTLEHEKSYYDMNRKLKSVIPTEVNSDEDYMKAKLAYRQIPNEVFADKWAIDFMYKHFPDEFFEEDLSEC